MLVLHQVGPGEFYGSLVGTAPADSGAQVEAVVDSQGAHFATSAIVRLMESYACVGVAMTRQLAARIDALVAWLARTGIRRAASHAGGKMEDKPDCTKKENMEKEACKKK